MTTSYRFALAWTYSPFPTVIWIILVVVAASGATRFRLPCGRRSLALLVISTVQLLAMAITISAFDPFVRSDAGVRDFARRAYTDVWLVGLPTAALGVVVGFYVALFRGGRIVGLALVAACMFSLWYSADYNT